MRKKSIVLTHKEFKEIFSKVPRLAVEAVIMTPDGIVLTKRKIVPRPGTWHVPGGTMQKGETIAQAVKRVAKAETGIDVELVKMLGVVEYDFKGYFSQPIGLAHLVRPKNINFKMKVDENAEDIRIFEKLPPNTFKEHRQFLKRFSIIK